MDFWQTVWSTVIALLVVAVISAAAGTVWVVVKNRLSPRPDFLLKWDGFGWVLERAKRRVAFAVEWGVGNEEGVTVTPTMVRPLPEDFSRGMRYAVNDLTGNRTFWMAWIDRRRCSSGVVELEEGVKLYKIFAQKKPRRRLVFFTS